MFSLLTTWGEEMSFEITPGEKGKLFAMWIIGIIFIAIVVYGLALREVATMPERAEIAKTVLEPSNIASYLGLVVIVIIIALAGWVYWRGKAEKVGVWYQSS
jgi:cytochrome b561